MHPVARLFPLLAVVAVGVASLGGARADSSDVVILANYTCSATRTYTDDSPYGRNLADLLSTLSRPATVDNWWFRSRTVGAAPDQASGLAMCFADSDPKQCRSCLASVSSQIWSSVCDHSRNVSFMSTGGCVIRYADAPPFFSSGSTTGLIILSYDQAVDAAATREARRGLLSELAERAGGDALRFAAGSQGYKDAVLGKWQVMYGMAQCTRDVAPSECAACLVDLLAVMYRDASVTNSSEASVMGFSCYLRYQTNKPIDIAGMAAPPAEPPTGSAAPAEPVGRTAMIAALAAVAGALMLALQF